MVVADMIIGIDPGKQGGIATWKPNRGMKVFKMPETVQDMMVLFNLLKEQSEKPLCFIEKVTMRSDDTGGKQYHIKSLLANFEQLKACLTIASIPYVMVHPMTWQTYLHLRQKGEEKPDRKKRYKIVAGNYYPEIKATLLNCDAMLLVEFGRRKKQFDEQWIIEQLPKQTLKLIL
jgi:hypothetical protein